MSYQCGLFGTETYGGAPPEGTSSANVNLAEAVGFIDRVCAYASTALQKSTGALATVHRSIFPNQPSSVDVDALASPFDDSGSTHSYLNSTTTHELNCRAVEWAGWPNVQLGL